MQIMHQTQCQGDQELDFLYSLWSEIVATLRSISKSFPGEFRN